MAAPPSAPLRAESTGTNVHVVREVAPGFLTAEAADFLATLTAIAEEHFRLIDRELLGVCFKKWRYAVRVLATHTRLQPLLPALVA